MSEFCTYVELNEAEVGNLLKESAGVCRNVALAVATSYGKNATVRVSSATGRPHAFVNAPYEEASEDNKLLKAVQKQ